MLAHFIIAVILFLIAAIIGSATVSVAVCLLIKLVKRTRRKEIIQNT